MDGDYSPASLAELDALISEGSKYRVGGDFAMRRRSSNSLMRGGWDSSHIYM